MEACRSAVRWAGAEPYLIWPGVQMRLFLDFSFSPVGLKEEGEQLLGLAAVMAALGVTAALLLLFVTEAKYGRYAMGCSSLWGFQINGKAAWVLQELPNLVMGVSNILQGRPECLGASGNQILLALFMVHYINRTFLYPGQIRGGKPTPISVFLLAFIFCLFNGHLQTRFLSHTQVYGDSWLLGVRFWGGVIVFLAGMYINVEADAILRNLRKPGETGYKIPTGGAFRLVSAANFFGEILEWAGFALAQCSWPAAAFAFFTLCNIGPRGWQHHLWYKRTFGDKYPRARKAVIPFLL